MVKSREWDTFTESDSSRYETITILLLLVEVHAETGRLGGHVLALALGVPERGVSCKCPF